ncbi:uncharacterized protein [Haliotis asinina]|uniref:uncharacterized protein n=1 Tax=Haliotis asinina TaxID=109174 RepID=UPI003531810E
MMDVSFHLLQPLSIDTNITYDLDMSKFPGLDDPQQMYQPALLIATDWSDYVYHDDQCATNDDDVFEDDLYSLIESSAVMFTDFTDSNKSDFEALLDEVITDTTTDCCNLLDLSDFTDLDLTSSTDSQQSELSPLCGRGQKRRHSIDNEHLKTKKKYKMAEVEMHSSLLPSLVSVCPTSKNCMFGRDS